MTTRTRTARIPHRHSKAQCLKILRTLSEYLDDNLPKSICKEIRKHLGACSKCERFVRSLKRTINLCQRADVSRLTPSDKRKLRNEILNAVARL